jgi:hypothetical protein
MVITLFELRHSVDGVLVDIEFLTESHPILVGDKSNLASTCILLRLVSKF